MRTLTTPAKTSVNTTRRMAIVASMCLRGECVVSASIWNTTSFHVLTYSIVVTRQSELLEAHPDRVSNVVPHLSVNLFLSQTSLRVSTSFRAARIVTYVPALVDVCVFFDARG